MRPDECRECWIPECLAGVGTGEEPDWKSFGRPGEHCPFYVPPINTLSKCPCCSLDDAMLDVIEVPSGLGTFVMCENCGTSTRIFDRASDAVDAWNSGEVYSE